MKTIAHKEEIMPSFQNRKSIYRKKIVVIDSAIDRL